MSQWRFKDGKISDGQGSEIAFNELVKFAEGAVRGINGDELPISLTDSEKLGGIPASQYASKAYVPASVTNINTTLRGKSEINPLSIKDEKVLGLTMVKYTGQNTDPYIPTMGEELFPNSTFENTDDITAGNDASLSVSGGVLTVNANDTDYPYAEMITSTDLYKDHLYIIKMNMGATNPKIEVIDPDGNIIINKIGESGRNEVLTLKANKDGKFKVRMYMNGGGDDDSATFSKPSFKELDIASLKHGNFYSLDKATSNVKTTLITEVPSKDLHWSSTYTYSKEEKNNLAFFRNSFTLLKYINDEAGKSGILSKEYMVDGDGEYIGDFNKDTDVDAFTAVGTQTVIKRDNDTLRIERKEDETGKLEAYVEVDIDKKGLFLLDFEIKYIGYSDWHIYIDDVLVRKEYSDNSDTDREHMLIVANLQNDKAKVKFVSTDVDSNNTHLSIDNLRLKAIDPEVWEDITPKNTGEKTEIFKWDNAVYDIKSVTDPDASQSIFSTMLGKTIRHIPMIDERNTDYRYNSVRQFNNNGITFGSYSWGLNRINDKIVATIMYFDKLVMEKTKNGSLYLIAYNKHMNHSMVLGRNNNFVGDVIDPRVTDIENVYTSDYSGNSTDKYYYFKRPGDKYNGWLAKTSTNKGEVTVDRYDTGINISKNHFITDYFLNKTGTGFFIVRGKSEYNKNIGYHGVSREIVFETIHKPLSIMASSLTDYRYNTQFFVDVLRGDNFLFRLNLSDPHPETNQPDVIEINNNNVRIIETEGTGFNNKDDIFYIEIQMMNDYERFGVVYNPIEDDASITTVDSIDAVVYEDIDDARGILCKPVKINNTVLSNMVIEER